MGSTSGPFMLTNLEDRLSITEDRIGFFDDFCEGSGFEEQNVRRVMLGTVAEEILFGGVSVEVEVKLESSFVFLFES